MKVLIFSNALFNMVLIFAMPVLCYSQKYNEYCGSDSAQFTYYETIENSDIKITFESENRVEVCITDTNYHCKQWNFKSKSENLDFSAALLLDTIHIKGIKKGREFNSLIFVDKQPWIQFWEYGISKMISQKKTKMTFISIDPHKPENAALFYSKTEGLELIHLANGDESAVLVSIQIKGVPALLFKAKLWFNKKDNKFIKSEMPQGPFFPITKIEISNEGY